MAGPQRCSTTLPGGAKRRHEIRFTRQKTEVGLKKKPNWHWATYLSPRACRQRSECRDKRQAQTFLLGSFHFFSSFLSFCLSRVNGPGDRKQKYVGMSHIWDHNLLYFDWNIFFLDSSCSTILHSVQDSLSIMLTSAVRVVCPVCVCVCLLWAQCMDPGGCSKGYVWKQGSKMLADPVAIINDSDRPDLTHSITLCLAHHQVI